MKKLTLLLVSLFALVIGVQAQMEKGMKNIGGVLTFQKQDLGSKITTFQIEPAFNYFIADKFSVGALVGYSSVKYEYTGFSQTTNIFGIGLQARKHFLLSETVAWYINGALNFGFGSETTESGGTPTKDGISDIGVEITPGFLIFLTPKIGLETGFGSLGFLSRTLKPETGSNTTQSSYGLSLNTNTLYFGFRCYMP